MEPLPPIVLIMSSLTGTTIGPPEPLVAATLPPRPPPQVTTGIFAPLAASSPAPIEEKGNTMSTIAAEPRCAKFWIPAFA